MVDRDGRSVAVGVGAPKTGFFPFRGPPAPTATLRTSETPFQNRAPSFKRKVYAESQVSRVRNRTTQRCAWATGDPLLLDYHDREWGVPVHDDRHWFQKILLDGAQAGLSWVTILRKREGYREAFCAFDPQAVARFGERDVVRLMANPNIVRNRLKIESAIKNAKAFIAVQQQHGTFDSYIWEFVGGATQHNRFRAQSDVPAQTELSCALSKDLKRRGFSFVGTTIVYAFMQSAGVVNDHLVSCFRYRDLKRKR
jgi:DNA-3-methyladenine glycosylase I